MHYKNLIMIIVIILLLLILYFIQKENFNDKNYSFQSLQNLSSVFGDINGTLSVNNIKILDRLDAANFKGIIVQWSGSIKSIPAGWALCDGSGGRPDLRGRFILGYNNGIAVNGSSDDGSGTNIIAPGISGGAQCGSDLAGTIGRVGGEFKHTFTVNELPAHTHDYIPIKSWHEGGHGPINTGDDDAGLLQSNTTSAGGSESHYVLPPFYVLAYIIKL